MKRFGAEAKRILVVEDEPAICDICQRVLTGEGFEVEIAVDGKVVQNLIEEKQYGLCLIDIRTPRMNGKELYQWLQEKKLQLASRVIFTTGDVIGEDTQHFLEQAARLFLPKPFSTDELKTVIKEASKQVEK